MHRSDEDSAARPRSRRFPPAVWALGWVSLLTDAGSEMVYPLLPELLALVGGGAAALGMVEGAAEAVAAASRYWIGAASDRAQRRKPFVVAGYALAALARPLFALVTGPWQVALVRSLDRVGKGMRGPPRDALLAAAAPERARGAAFGLHRMMDNLGAAIGPALAFVLMHWVGLSLRQVFVATLLPGALSVLVLALGVREPPRSPRRAEAAAPAGGAAPLPRPARRFLLAFAVFALAGSADAFLLRRLLDLGLAVSLLPIAWVSLQLTKSLVNVPGGRAADRFGHRRVLLAAWLVYALAYGAFGFATSVTSFWALVVAYALYYGLAEGGQRAILVGLVPAAARGRAFGVQQTIEGLMVLPANVAFGLVYAKLGPRAAFLGGAGVALLAFVLLATLVPRPAVTPPRTSP